VRNTNANANGNCKSDGDSDCDSDCHCYCDSHSYSYTYGNCYTDADIHAETCSNTEASPNPAASSVEWLMASES
jgi:hypothetical protein